MLGVGYIADYTAKANLIMKVLDFIKFGGPTWMVGSTIFEMWLGALCNAQATCGLHNGGRG